MTPRRVGVVGAGFTGLTAAYKLAEAGCEVELLEAGNTVGGLAVGFEIDGFRLERAYHFLYRTDEYMLGMLDELELTEKLTYHASSVATIYDGVVYPMMTPLDLLRFKPLPLHDRIRAGVTVLYLQRVRNWERLTKVTALDWLRKWAGRRVTDVIWEPLLRGKFDHYFDKVTMAWLWGRVKQRVDSRGDGESVERLGYFEGGFGVVVDSLTDRLEQHGADIHLTCPVADVRHDPETDDVVLTTVDGVEKRFDEVLLTVPSRVAASMLDSYRPEHEPYFEKLDDVDYLAAVVQVVVTDEPISDFYWHNVNNRDAPFVVFLSLSALIGTEPFDGKHVYYIGDYVPDDHWYMSAQPDQIEDHWLGEIERLFPDFERTSVVASEVSRFRDAQHIVHVGFEDKLADHQTPCPRVLLANFSQIYPMDRGTNYAVRDGYAMAERMLSESRQGADNGPRAD